MAEKTDSFFHLANRMVPYVGSAIVIFAVGIAIKPFAGTTTITGIGLAIFSDIKTESVKWLFIVLSIVTMIFSGKKHLQCKKLLTMLEQLGYEEED